MVDAVQEAPPAGHEEAHKQPHVSDDVELAQRGQIQTEEDLAKIEKVYKFVNLSKSIEAVAYIVIGSWIEESFQVDRYVLRI